jgi:hypothetical protein
MARLAEDEAYWDALGDTTFLDELGKLDPATPSPAQDVDMDMS